jgi:CRP-like cAMP-binding protein
LPQRPTKLISHNGAEAPVVQKNSLLAALPPDELGLVEKVAVRYRATLREVIFERDEPLDRVLFPLTAMGSIVTEMSDGTSIEAITVGREGMIGMPVFHGLTRNRSRTICQIGGDYAVISATNFREILKSAPTLTDLLHRYAQYSYEVLAQGMACNGSHLVEQRCARWLLTTARALDMTTFNLTQEFLSQMLAVRRPGVSLAVAALERRGLIKHSYGSLAIIDLNGLKKAACECYEAILKLEREIFSA